MDALPAECGYLALGAARIREIKSITSKLGSSEHGNRAYQNLPRHMQRRAVSSNPKRLPRYLREKHRRELTDAAKSNRRPPRKYRRRPGNLLLEYNRRQKEHVWLETHLWHAKRFHMTKKWGYSLPETPTCKGYRATLRAATKSCLLQDVSFLCCIELEGPYGMLLRGISSVVQPSKLSLLSNPESLKGQKWNSVTIFSPEKQPYGAVGDVDILWHPKSYGCDEVSADSSKLWLWVHPSAYRQILQILIEIYDLVEMHTPITASNTDVKSDAEISSKSETETSHLVRESTETKSKLENVEKSGCKLEASTNSTNDTVSAETENEYQTQLHKEKKDTVKLVNKLKLASRNIPYERTPKYVCSKKLVNMTLLKDTLNRFQLTGPKSYGVISAALHPSNVTPSGESTAIYSNDLTGVNDKWWGKYYLDQAMQQCHQRQVEAWRRLALQAIPSYIILPMTVRDPRVTLPHKKLPTETTHLGTGDSIPEWPQDSPLFDAGVRDAVTETKEPDAAINSKRSQLLVPGSKLPETPEESRLPLLLLSRPPTHSSGHGSGWDIIVPAGWGMCVWMSLLFCGGVCGGQREATNLHMETLRPLPPNLLPDTPAGDYYAKSLAHERRTHFFKRPPSNRLNFITQGIQFPFYSPWTKLLREWVPGVDDIFILRDTKILKNLASVFGDAAEKTTNKMMSNKRKPNTSREEEEPRKKNPKIANVCEENNKTVEVSSEVIEKMSVGGDCAGETIVENLVMEAEFHPEMSLETELQGLPLGCLVPVRIVMEGKSKLEPCALICLPEEKDLNDKIVNPMPKDDKVGLREPLHVDTQEEHRAKLKEEHKKIKGRLQRQRHKARSKASEEMDMMMTGQSKRTLQEAIKDSLDKVHKENEAILAKYSSFNSEMEEAWLMQASEPLQCCSRKIMGYVSLGDFSMTLGRGAGIGWVALKPLVSMIETYKTVQNQLLEDSREAASQLQWKQNANFQYSVLVRNPSSLQYRWAMLSIIVGDH